MDRFDFWQRWLLISGVIVVVGGLGIALLSRTAVFDMLDHPINTIFWGTVDVPAAASSYQGFIYGLTGAVMAGWGVCIAFIAAYPFQRREPWAWACLLVGLTLWYVVDTGFSLAYGVVFNAIGNTVLLIAAGLPLVLTRRHFTGQVNPGEQDR